MQNQNRIATYSLLAHINNNSIGIKNFIDIFKPLIKRVLMKMCNEGKNKGEDIFEIKQRFDTNYNLDIPIPLLKEIVGAISKEENRKEGSSFALYNDGAFIIDDYTFVEYEDEINKQEKDIEYLNEAYQTYLKIHGKNEDQEDSIFDFLDSNRVNISRMLSRKENGELDFTIQAEFIRSIKDRDDLYGIIKRIYLGSVISSYLELNVGEVNKKLEFVFDTNFIINLLDLNSEESTHTTRKIVEICDNLGYELTVLQITLEETKALIDRTADAFEKVFLAKRIDNESIYNACDRRGLKRTDLQRISDKLERKLNEFGISLIPNDKKFRNEAKFSDEYEIFKKIRGHELAALHDATVIKYVQKKRNGLAYTFENSKCWFVTDTKHQITYLQKTNSLPEIIRAENLINILWLSQPGISSKDITEVGLTQLISSTLRKNLPSSRILMELDDNIQKYAKDKIENDDIVKASNRIALKSTQELEELNRKAEEHPRKFIEELNQLAKESDAESEKIEKKYRDYLLTLSDKHKERIKDLRNNFQAKSEKKFEKLKGEYETEIQGKQSEIKTSKDKIDKIDNRIISISNYITIIILGLILALPIALYFYFVSDQFYDEYEMYTLPVGLLVFLIEYLCLALLENP